MPKSIVPQNPDQLPLFPEEPKPRGVVLNGIAYIAIYDAYRLYGYSSNPSRDWKRDRAELARQGYDIPKLVGHNFGDNRNGQTTPVASEEQIARIAQVAKFPEWEPIRQRMAELLVADHRGKSKAKVPQKQTKEYRQLIDSGYNDAQAQHRMDVREHSKDNFRMVSAVWYKRGGDIGALADRSTLRATGKHVWEWKREWQIKESPRNYFSTALLSIMALVERLAMNLSEAVDSNGTDELARDIDRATGYVDFEGLRRDYPTLFVKRPLVAPGQRKLLKDGQ